MIGRCPDCGYPLGMPYQEVPEDSMSDLWCDYCQYEHHSCPTCGEPYSEESDAGDCEYSHRTVLDDMIDAL